jgi:hypothetical protein
MPKTLAPSPLRVSKHSQELAFIPSTASDRTADRAGHAEATGKQR